jgi:glycosyltransferase involved in cell wall biosynthesis
MINQCIETRRNVIVSAIVSTYKAEAFMRECLTDLINQTVADRLEIIIIDAASPENEGAIARECQDLHPNILYIRTPHRISIYAAWNLAIRNASAPFITPFSTNDRLSRNAYEQLFSALNTNPDVMLVYGDTYLTGTPHQTFEHHDRIGAYRWPPYSYEFLVAMNCVGPHPMWRKAVHDSIGYFDERYIALADQEFWLRMGERYKLLHTPVVTGLYWQSTTALSQQRVADEEFRAIRREYARRYLRRLNSQ